ncbi:MAG: hypothetical protein IJQ34_04890 [Kiritimatiellae bacterium]|nr:hypothetical protein [Kiritimatiellia bacterium]
MPAVFAGADRTLAALPSRGGLGASLRWFACHTVDWDYPISFIMGICALEGSVKILTILASVDEGSVKILTVLATVDEGSIKILTVLATVVEGSVKILTVLATVVEGSVKILTVLSTKVEGCLMLPMWKCCQ